MAGLKTDGDNMEVTTAMALGADPVCIANARTFVEARAVAIGELALVPIIELLVSELVTNAILHSPSPTRLQVDIDDDRIRVEVEDRGERRPRLLEAQDALRANGRGLHVVDRLADQWGWDPVDGGGKVVWFEVLRSAH
jgi:anti-sigma regulatory factor (Ser/Thr protein kinase)